MTEDEALAIVHRDLPRQGPGTPEDVRWALDLAGLRGRVRVCDAGCGPGADLEALAEALPEAELLGIEMMPHLAEEARARCARFANVTVEAGDMAALPGRFDLIWCAGALYFLGVTDGLRLWRGSLNPGGLVAFSEPMLAADAPKAARACWKDYPFVTDLAGIEARIAAAGYETLGHRLITGAAWETEYYTPMKARLEALKPASDPALAAYIEAMEQEIDLWQAAPDHVAYALMLVRPGAENA